MAAPLALSVVIPSCKRPELLRVCLERVQAHQPANSEVVVVDDASRGGAISRVARSFGASCVRLSRRGGFAVAANAGIAGSRGEIVELLNDDTEVQAGWAEAALEHFADARVAAVAPLVLTWPDGERIDSAGDRYHLGGFAGKRGHGQRTARADLHARLVFGASASTAFYRRTALEQVGGFPTCFGSYFEDVDLAFRLQRAGFRAVFEPGSRVLHHVGASHDKRDRRLLGQQSLNEERVFWRNVPLRAMPVALPLHMAVLIAKGMRRWSEGAFWPFLWGRLRLLGELPSLWRHRRSVAALGPAARPGAWQIDMHHAP